MRQSTKTGFTPARGFHAFLPCRAAVVVPDPHLRGRDYPPSPCRDRVGLAEAWRQALLVLVYLRKGETFAGIAAGFGDGTATAWRYVNETTALLAARAPKLRQAVRAATKAGARLRRRGRHLDPGRPGCRGPALLLRQAQEARDEPAGHRQHILWVSGALPGSVHDKKAEWIWGVLAEAGGCGPGHPGR